MTARMEHHSTPARFICLKIVAACCSVVVVVGCERGESPNRNETGLPAAVVSSSSKPVAENSQAQDRPNRITAGLSRLRDREVRQSVLSVEAPNFQETSAESGVDFVYENGVGGRLMVEGTGGGAGWLDYDRDGQWDLYLVQGGEPVSPGPMQPSDKLFRNMGAGVFTEVTALSGVTELRFGQGVSVGDYDNDGFDDVFVTNVGGDVLFHNLGDGTFENASPALAGNIPAWSTSAAWADFDLDGDLDLYVCRYCGFDPAHPKICRNAQGVSIMCQPQQVPPIPDVLFVNQGDGRFLEQAHERGLFGTDNRALGVAVADFDNDSWPDVYVANDASPNFLFINQRNGQFVDSAVQLGCGLMVSSQAQGSMGIAVGDYDRNGFLDLYVTNFEGEGDTLYQNQGLHGFQEVSGPLGLVQPTLAMVGWGVVMADFNQDGQEDLFVANGNIDDGRHVGGDLAQNPLLFSFDGRKWIDVTAKGGPFFQKLQLGRGVAAGDYDNDGDLDLVVVHQNSPTALLRNDSTRQHWLKVELIGRTVNRRGVGARVFVRMAGQTLMQELAGGTSFCSSSQPCLCFGLGAWAQPVTVEVRWPGGGSQTLENVTIDQRLLVLQSEADLPRKEP